MTKSIEELGRKSLKECFDLLQGTGYIKEGTEFVDVVNHLEEIEH